MTLKIRNEYNPTKKRVVIYCRVSSKGQVDEGGSLSSQEKVIREYALRKDYEIVETFIEKGESAKTKDRTELDRLLKFCRKKENGIKSVLFYKVDRWARKSFDYSSLRFQLELKGIKLESATESIEDTPAGRYLETMLAGQAQFDNDIRAERSLLGMKDALQNGRYCWKAPLGYNNIRIQGKATLAINTEVAPKIVRTFTLMASNKYNIDELWKKMKDEGLRTSSGKPVSRSNFYNILRNSTYIAKVRAFRQEFQGCFEPIIKEEVFEQVQRVLNLRGKKSSFHKRDNPDFPLRRFVKHPKGEKITGSWSTGRNKKYAFYRFGQKGINISRNIFEEKFRNFLDSFSIPSRLNPRLIKFLKQEFLGAIQDKLKVKRELEHKIKELKEQQSALITKNFKGIISDEILKKQLELVETDLMELYTASHAIPVEEYSFEKLLKYVCLFLKKPSKIWLLSSFEEKIRLQWFQFPNGVTFDGVNFGTEKIACILRLKELILQPLSNQVPPSAEFWMQFVDEGRYLTELFSTKENDTKL